MVGKFIDIPVFAPTLEEFNNPDQYLQSIKSKAQHYGMAKIQCPELYRQELANLDLKEYPIPGNSVISQEVTARKTAERCVSVPEAGMAGDTTIHGKWGHVSNSQYRTSKKMRTLGAFQQHVQERLASSTSSRHRHRSSPLYAVDLRQSILATTIVPWQCDRFQTNIFPHLRQSIPGVSQPYVYLGTRGSLTAIHCEDGGAYSMNLLIQGEPKQWRGIQPKDNEFLETLTDVAHFDEYLSCAEYMSHKSVVPYATTLQNQEIDVLITCQLPGELVITYPTAYHWVWNEGFNVAEAWNYGDKEYLESLPLVQTCHCPYGTGISFTKNDFQL